MSLEKDSEVTSLRALAHPLRLQLLRLAAETGELTTSAASLRTGESSANCSFHLRLLARHGFLEPAPGRDRRERPWRVAARHPLAPVLAALAGLQPARDRRRDELVRGQLRIFDPDRLELAA
ncbi:MAG TPA: helix-turn-helix domain-containing protein [Gaiellaceae bacterium]|jgi:DNA-binding transcriptional ArsR family regulator|nr:helix-turn-helix domain-containing protein [Gaiellaceae bacterium]